MAITNLKNQLDLRVYVNPMATGNSADQSPYVQASTEVDAPTVDANGIVLNGTSQYITYPDQASNSLFSNNELTIGVWFNVDTVDAVDQVLLAKWDEGDNNKAFRLFIDATTDVIQAIVSSDGSIDDLDLSTTETISPSTDYFVVLTWDGARVRIYIDGDEKTAAFYSSGIYDSDEVISIGADFNTTAQSFTDGTIYQAFLLGRCLSDQQIGNLFLHPQGKDYQIVEPSKELLFSENFRAGKVPNDWLVTSGSYTVEYDNSLGEYYLECLTEGVIGIPIPAEMQDLTQGGFEWEWDMYKEGAGNAIRVYNVASGITEHNDSSQNGYQVQVGSFEQVQLVRKDNGVGTLLNRSAVNFITNLTWYTYKLTRGQDTPGQYAMYLDGSLIDVTDGEGINPTTDTTHTTTKYLAMDLDAGDRIKNIVIRRF